MDLTKISEYVDLSGLKNLNNIYVVTKKYTNKTYYYGCHNPSRPDRWAHSSRFKNANKAILFNSKDDAQKKCDELNAQRSRIKFKVEEASKHFVSNFSLQYTSYSDKPIKIVNSPVSLQDYKDADDSRKKSVNTAITTEMIQIAETNLQKINTESQYFVKNIGQITLQKMRELEMDYNRRVQELNARLASDLQTNEKKLNMASNVITMLKDGTIEKFVVSNKTGNDDKFEILYGKGGTNGNS